MVEHRSQRAFTTHEVDAARLRVTDAFGDHQLTPVRAERLNMRLDAVKATSVTVGRLSYGAEVRLNAPEMSWFHHINLPIKGKMRVAQRNLTGVASGNETGVAMGPHDPLGVEWGADCVSYSMRVPSAPLQTQLEKLLGRDPGELIRFNIEFPVRDSRARSLYTGARFLRTELARPDGLATMPAVMSELESMLLTRVLFVVPHQYSAELNKPHAAARRGSVQRAVELIEAHPDQSLDIFALAQAAGVSARTLQAGFRAELNMSPLAYLRSVRLDRIHAELLSGQGDSVTDVAMKWSFYHVGRFAQQYRSRFGVAPSETLRRGRNG
jgi:AraC-like DNA-binding protein